MRTITSTSSDAAEPRQSEGPRVDARAGDLPAAGVAPASSGQRQMAAVRRIMPLGLLVLVIGVWQVLPGVLNVPEFIIPQFSAVVANLLAPAVVTQLISNGAVTVEESLLGLAIGCASGVLLGLLLGESATARGTLYPYIVALQSLPKVAIAPLFVIWFGFGLTPKILVAVTLTFFPLLVNTMSGVMSVDRDQADLFRALCCSRRQLWTKLLLPSALPSVFAGLEVATVLALLGAIVGEFVSAKAGLGLLLQEQQNNYDTAGMFATLLVLAAIGVFFNQTVVQTRKRVVFWQNSQRDGEDDQ